MDPVDYNEATISSISRGILNPGGQLGRNGVQPAVGKGDFSRSDIDRKANTRRRKRWLIRAMKRIPVVRSCSCGGRKRDLSRFAYQFRLPSPASPLGLPVFVRINYPRVSSRRAFRFRNRFYILFFLFLLVEIETLPFF